MGDTTKIAWCDSTFNPWIGCTRVSPACDYCYAADWAKRTGQAQLWAGKRRRTTEANWRKPLKWNREAEKAGVRRRVFCASLADVFDNAVSELWRADLFALIRDTPKLDWLLLTKRIGNAWAMSQRAMWDIGFHGGMDHSLPANVWIGSTVVTQAEVDRDVPKLLAVPASVRFLSCEPLLEAIDLSPFLADRAFKDPSVQAQWSQGIDWVIVGGESGSKARPMNADDAWSIRQQCQLASVAFFFKQGSAANWPDFKNFETFPESLRVREFPK